MQWIPNSVLFAERSSNLVGCYCLKVAGENREKIHSVRTFHGGSDRATRCDSFHQRENLAHVARGEKPSSRSVHDDGTLLVPIITPPTSNHAPSSF